MPYRPDRANADAKLVLVDRGGAGGGGGGSGGGSVDGGGGGGSFACLVSFTHPEEVYELACGGRGLGG